MRQIEEVHKSFGQPRTGPEYHGLRRQLDEFKEAFKTCHNNLRKAARERS
jgi:hypothetical protein